LGKAILVATKQNIPITTDVSVVSGKGLKGVVEGQNVLVGSPEFCFDGQWPDWADSNRGNGSLVAVSVNQTAAGLILIGDLIRSDAKEAILSLRSLSIEPVLISGDREKTVFDVATATGITQYYATAQPEEKLRLVKEYQTKGQTAMIGDGINDSLALAQADFSISMGEGSAAARESADLTLTSGGLSRIPIAIKLSRQIMRTVRQNLLFAFSYNLVAIPMAFTGKLHPGIAGGMMALSSVLLVMNSLKLRRWRGE
jgi:Cu+-exporting ATPase